jgi:ribosomal protein L7/L12
MDFEADTRNRLHSLEQKIDFLLRELGLVEKEEANRPYIDPGLTEIVALLQQNKKIEAITLYRKKTGSSLREAKEAVEKFSY